MSKFERAEVVQRLREALAFAYVDAAMDDEVSIEGCEGDEALDVQFVQYSLETNEPIARFSVSFRVEELPL
ncbi:hypothetical protein [Microbacterium sp. NPDC055599]